MHTSFRAAEYPALGEEGIAATLAVVDHQVGSNSFEPGRAFQALFEGSRSELATIIGTLGVQAVFTRALAVCRRRHPLLYRVEFERGSIKLDLPKDVAEASAVRRHLTDLFLTVMDVLSSLISFELVHPILERIDHRSGKEYVL